MIKLSLLGFLAGGYNIPFIKKIVDHILHLHPQISVFDLPISHVHPTR